MASKRRDALMQGVLYAKAHGLPVEATRVQEKFWLNWGNPDEFELALYIDERKAVRGYSDTLRTGLTLDRAHRERDFDTVRRELAWFENELAERIRGELAQRIGEMQEEMRQVKERLAVYEGVSGAARIDNPVQESESASADVVLKDADVLVDNIMNDLFGDL